MTPAHLDTAPPDRGVEGSSSRGWKEGNLLGHVGQALDQGPEDIAHVSQAYMSQTRYATRKVFEGQQVSHPSSAFFCFAVRFVFVVRGFFFFLWRQISWHFCHGVLGGRGRGSRGRRREEGCMRTMQEQSSEDVSFRCRTNCRM